jgi:hypothetical protein
VDIVLISEVVLNIEIGLTVGVGRDKEVRKTKSGYRYSF